MNNIHETKVAMTGSGTPTNLNHPIYFGSCAAYPDLFQGMFDDI